MAQSIVELADSRTLSAIWRPDGDCGCGMTDMAGECKSHDSLASGLHSSKSASDNRAGRREVQLLLPVLFFELRRHVDEGSDDARHGLRQAATAGAGGVGWLQNHRSQRPHRAERRAALRGER